MDSISTIPGKEVSVKRIASPLTRVPWHLLLLLGFTLIGLAFRVNNLDMKSLWVDEIGQALQSRNGFLTAIIGASHHFGAAPLDYVLTYIVTKTLGQGDAALRLPAVLWGTAAIPLVYWLGMNVYSSRQVALVSAALMAFNPALIQYSQEVRWYSLSAMLALLSTNLVFVAVRNRHPLSWIALSLMLLLSVTTSMHHALTTMALFVPLVLCWQLLGYTRDQCTARPQGTDIVMFVVAATPAAAFVLYWTFSGLLRKEVNDTIHFDPIALERLVFWPTLGYFGTLTRQAPDPMPILRLLFFPILPALGLTVAAFQRKLLPFLPLLVILICATGIYAIDAIYDYFWAARQFTYLTPFYLLMVAFGLVSASRLIRRPQWLSTMVLVCTVGLVLWWTLPQITAYYNYQKANWRGTAKLLYQSSGNLRTPIYFRGDLHRFLYFYQPDLKRHLSFDSDLEPSSLPTDPHYRIWFSGPADKLDELNELGWNSVPVDAGVVGRPTVLFHYVGQVEEETLYRELIELELPPEVLASDFLYRLDKIDHDLAVEVATAAITGFIDLPYPVSSLTRSDIATNLGRIQFDAGQTDEGLAMIEGALEIDPTNRVALSNLGEVYLSLNNADAARSPLKKCTRLYPESYECTSDLARSYVETNEWLKAADTSYRAYELAPSEELRQRHLADAIDAYKSAGKLEKAQELQSLLIPE